jgi:hypothetical protein
VCARLREFFSTVSQDSNPPQADFRPISPDSDL